MRTICSIITLIAVSSIPLSSLAATSPFITQNYPWLSATKDCKNDKSQAVECYIGLPIGTDNWMLMSNDSNIPVTVMLTYPTSPLDTPNIVLQPKSAKIVQIDKTITPQIILIGPSYTINEGNITACPTGGSSYRYGLAINEQKNTAGYQIMMTCGIIPGCIHAIPGALPKFMAYSNGLNHVPMGAVAHYCQN